MHSILALGLTLLTLSATIGEDCGGAHKTERLAGADSCLSAAAPVWLAALPHSVETTSPQVVVFGDTPCGVAAAIAAARANCNVVLVASGSHVGGMMSAGLSITDVRLPTAHGGLFREFTQQIESHYARRYGPGSKQVADCHHGLWFEPHVAEDVFETMLREQPKLTVYRNQRLVEVISQKNRVVGLVVADRKSGERHHLMARVFIDASYEGDLAAKAGVPCRVGRESREEFWEPYAGHGFLKNPGLKVLPGGTGAGDRRIQAYNFRLTMTDRDDIRVAVKKPAHYDRRMFTPLIPLAQQGKLKTLGDIIRLAPIPNGKYCANNRPVVRSLDLPAVNTDWPEGGEQRRAAILQQYRDYTLGLLWFVQHDAELPESLRRDALRWGFCADEFADNDHLPHQLYVREARRIVGRKTFTAHDAFLTPGGQRAPIHEDSIAVADYHVDSHIVQRQAAGWPHIEGHVYLRPISKPAQVPLGIMLPREIQGLLVPGAVSATHLGFSVLRMEPVWMSLGQAAGRAAAMAVHEQVDCDKLAVDELQRSLLADGAVISFFYDVPGPDPIWLMHNMPQEKARLELLPNLPAESYCPGIQFLATRGYFSTYFARPHDPITRSEAARWLYRFAAARDVLHEAAEAESFPDVPTTHPDHKFVSSLRATGIVDSWADTRGFYPAAALSRGEATEWIVRLLKASGQDVDTSPIEATRQCPWSDVQADNPTTKALATLHCRQITPRCWQGSDRVEPRHYLTRNEFCWMLYQTHFILRPTKSSAIDAKSPGTLR